MRLSCALFVALLAGCSVYDVATRGMGDDRDAASPGVGGQTGVTTGISGVTGGTDSGSGGAGGAGTAGLGGGGGIGTAGGGAGLGGGSGTGGSGGSTGSGPAGSGGTGGGGGTGAGGSATGGGGASSGSGGAGGGTGGAGGSGDAGTIHAFLESGGAFSIEAEHFGASFPGTGAAQGLTWQNSTAQPNTSGSCEHALPNAGVNLWDSTVGPQLAFDLKFSGTGTYAVWVRILGEGMMADSVHVAMDSAPPVTYGGHGMRAGSTTWVWTDLVSGLGPGGGGTAPAQINVAASGYHTLRVYMRESGVAIDKIVLTRSGPAPSGLGPPESARE